MSLRFGDGNDGKVRAIAIPLIVGARVVGVLEARNTEARVATKEVIEILEMLATHAATAIESARLHEVIEQRSQVDALTRLLNRRRLEELEARGPESSRPQLEVAVYERSAGRGALPSLTLQFYEWRASSRHLLTKLKRHALMRDRA